MFAVAAGVRGLRHGVCDVQDVFEARCTHSCQKHCVPMHSNDVVLAAMSPEPAGNDHNAAYN